MLKSVVINNILIKNQPLRAIIICDAKKTDSSCISSKRISYGLKLRNLLIPLEVVLAFPAGVFKLSCFEGGISFVCSGVDEEKAF